MPRLRQKYVFYAALSPLIAFYGLFTTLLYPLHGTLHLNGFYAATAAVVPQGLHGLLKGALCCAACLCREAGWPEEQSVRVLQAVGGPGVGRRPAGPDLSSASNTPPPPPTPTRAVIEYWTFSLFYCASELWGSVVISVLFWTLANEVCTVSEAKVS